MKEFSLKKLGVEFVGTFMMQFLRAGVRQSWPMSPLTSMGKASLSASFILLHLSTSLSRPVVQIVMSSAETGSLTSSALGVGLSLTVITWSKHPLSPPAP